MHYLATILGIALCIPVIMFKKAFETNIQHQSIELATFKDPNPFRLFFISDIHRRNISDDLVEEVGTDIDAVIIGGDLAESGVPLEQIERNINRLAKIGPLFYVWGNNDREVGEHHIRKFIQNVGGTILENEAIRINTNTHHLWIVGIEDVSSGRADIKKSFENVPENDPIIFLSHTPFVFNKVIDRFKPDVLLAGHTHGGQIRLGNWGYYERGEFKQDQERFTLISNGFGTTFIPFRLGAPAECHILTIKHKEV